MATNYAKGRRQEWNLKKALEADGWTVIRAAGSKGPYDLVAFPRSDFGNQRVIALQVKATNDPGAAKRLLIDFPVVFREAFETQLWVRCNRVWFTKYWDPSKGESTVRTINVKKDLDKA